MQLGDALHFALQLVTLLGVAWTGGWLMRRAGQPAVLGEMLAGILLGPTILGTLWPAGFDGLFRSSPGATAWRSELARLGMLFFLFFVGLEISLAQLKEHGRRAVAIGLAGTLAPLAAGIAIVYAIPGIWGPQAEEHRFLFALFIGAALANTANPVLARILLDLNLLRTDLGAVLMTATVVDDLIGWSLLALVFQQFHALEGADAAQAGGSAWQFLAVLGFFVGTIAMGRWVVLPVVRRIRRATSRSHAALALVVTLVLISAWFAEQLGLHAFLGPFLLGIGLAPTVRELGRAYDTLSSLVVGLFVPLYFVSMGLTANFIASFAFTLVAVILLVACASKVAGVFVAAAATGLSRPTSLGIAFGMNARGAIGIILASLGREHGIVNEPVYVALVLMALATSILAVPTMKHWLRPELRARAPSEFAESAAAPMGTHI